MLNEASLFVPWIKGAFFAFIGALIIGGIVFYFRNVGLTVQSFVMASPLILIHQFLFNLSYTIYPEVNKGWVLTTIIVTSVVFILSAIVGKENISINTFLAFACFLAGGWLLKI